MQFKITWFSARTSSLGTRAVQFFSSPPLEQSLMLSQILSAEMHLLPTSQKKESAVELDDAQMPQPFSSDP